MFVKNGFNSLVLQEGTFNFLGAGTKIAGPKLVDILKIIKMDMFTLIFYFGLRLYPVN